jgi:hypothetical protein
MQVYYRGERLAFTELQEPTQKASRPLAPAVRAMVVRKPKQDHPWRQAYQNMKPRLANQAAAASLVGMRTYASP